MLRRMLLIFAAVTLMLAAAVPASAQVAERGDREVPESVADLRLDAPVIAKIDTDLLRASGPQRVIVRLADGAVAEAPAISKTLKTEKVAGQDDFLQRARTLAPKSKVLARTQLVLNAVFMEVDASQISALAADPDVVSVHRVRDYQLDLSETVPYIGASAVQAKGVDGSGVKVAVLDSGVDYYHAALGGSGNPADYAADDPTIIEPGTFPNAKVVGGYDFTGSVWPNGPEAPDPDPIDDGPEAGHGTHVAHIIGGKGGVAPGADIYAVKVCSSVSTSCSGIALIQGMEWAVDPNGDGDTSDRMDIVNMSLGADYGTAFDDDLSLAVDNATALGVLSVTSAGNGSDKPFKVGTPAAAPSALAVAQTQVPSAVLQLISVGDPVALEAPAVFQPWSVEPVAPVSGVLQYGDIGGGNENGCEAFTGDLTGLVVLVDRGACNFTLKIKNVGDAGGVVGIIGLVAPGAPFSGGDGGDAPITIPGYMIDQADSVAMQGLVGQMVTVDPSNGIPLVGQMVGSSSRGPSMGTALLKPEIGAPGASVSAIAGTGVDEGPFGGTSGASPMVAGAAALMLDAYPGLSPAEVKARLVNTGNTDILTDPFSGLAPVTRIGGGEVDAYAALKTPVAAWDKHSLAPTLSFGQIDVAKETVKRSKKLTVYNYSDYWQAYYVEPSFRYEDDALSGAVEVKVSKKKIVIPPNSSRSVKVKIIIHGDLLPPNAVESGANGANPDALTFNEFDGYVHLIPKWKKGSEIHVPWHVLPRAASAELAKPWFRLHFDDNGEGEIALRNRGVGTAQNDLFSLIGVSENLPEGEEGGQAPTPDLMAVGVQTFPVGPGFCSAEESFVWQFAAKTWERKTHAVPETWVEWALDTDQDGVPDYLVFDFDLSFSGGLSDGRSVTWVQDLNAGTAGAFFFTQHAAFSGNVVHTICAEQIGLTAADMLTTNVDVIYVEAFDFYYGGPGDILGPFTITPLGERYFGVAPDVAGQSSDSFTVVDYGPFPGNTPELGVMITTDSFRAGNAGGSVSWLETLIIPAKDHAYYVWATLGGKLAN